MVHQPSKLIGAAGTPHFGKEIRVRYDIALVPGLFSTFLDNSAKEKTGTVPKHRTGSKQGARGASTRVLVQNDPLGLRRRLGLLGALLLGLRALGDLLVTSHFEPPGL